MPEPPELEERVSFVLDAIYAAYTTGWESLMETASTHHALAAEAIALGRMLVQLMPREPEAYGLLALMLHCEARREARYTSDGKFVPLDQQDTVLWSQSMMDEAERYLHSAAVFQCMGRYQLEAAIQSIHANRARTGLGVRCVGGNSEHESNQLPALLGSARTSFTIAEPKGRSA